jgi:hypothetical protein
LWGLLKDVVDLRLAGEERRVEKTASMLTQLDKIKANKV